MNGHTPGPWEAIDDAILCGDPDMAIGSVFPCDREKTTYGSGFTYGEVTKANARLIASAPELLECLRWYVENDEVGQMEGNEFWLEGKARAEAAIGKATGETP